MLNQQPVMTSEFYREFATQLGDMEQDINPMEMRLLWTRLNNPETYYGAFEQASLLREDILPKNLVSLRKTFGLNEPGCSVNCTYCTLGEQYVGSWNRNRLVDGIKNRISRFQRAFPECRNVELVGYWPGISNPLSSRFQHLVELIKTTASDSQSLIIGGDLGIIQNPKALSALKEAGLTYLHNNLETSSRLYPAAIGKPATRLEQKLQALELAHESGLKITSGILIGLGEEVEDLIELVQILRRLPVGRVVVNFMNYGRDPRVGERFADVRSQLTSDYALRVLVFLRLCLRPDQSLMVGCGVGRYLYNSQTFVSLLRVVDTLHVGSFLNLEGSEQQLSLLNRLQTLGYEVVPPPID